MNAKEALRYFHFVVTLGRAYYPNSEEFKAHELAIEALEKVETLEAENARLKELAFDRCPLHGQAFGNTPNYQDMFVDSKCEGYCRGAYDDEPLDECKGCVIHEYYEK